MPKHTIGQLGPLLSTAKRMIWGAFAGEAEAGPEMTGDIALSLVPVVGAYGDVRDLVKETARLVVPGGNPGDKVTLGIALLGIASEFVPPCDWIVDFFKHFSKTLNRSGPLWKTIEPLFVKSIGEMIDAAKAGTFDANAWPTIRKLFEYQELFLKMVTDGAYLRLVDDFLITSPAQLDRLNTISKALGADYAADFLKRVADRDTKSALRFVKELGEVAEANVTLLKNRGVLERVESAVNLGGAHAWDKDTVTKYARTVQETINEGNASKIANLDRFEEFLDVKGSKGILSDKNQIFADSGFQAELDVAFRMRDSGEKVIGLRLKTPAGTQPGDIDVLTEGFAIEVKKGPPGNYFGSMTRTELLEYFGNLKRYAVQNGKQAKLVVGEGDLPSDLQRVLGRLGVTLERH